MAGDAPQALSIYIFFRAPLNFTVQKDPKQLFAARAISQQPFGGAKQEARVPWLMHKKLDAWDGVIYISPDER